MSDRLIMATTPSPNRPWPQFLRPLLWWLLLVLVLFGYRQHQKWLALTRLEFSLTLNGQPVRVAPQLDGQPVSLDQNISLGSHTFSFSHPKTTTFHTNFFAWYGRHDLGEIKLQRGQGTLNIKANPPATTITITGPDFSQTLNDSAGTTLIVPSDQYEIHAEFPHWSQSQNVTVFDQMAGVCAFNPEFGALHLTCNRDGATYVLQNAGGQNVTSGTLPATESNLPTGLYQTTVTYHQRQMKQSVFVATGVTIEVPLEFVLGAVRLETEPSGADVRDEDGRYLGQTPLKVTDLSPPSAQFNLSLNGYDPVTVTAAVAGDRTIPCHTNLASLAYIGNLRSARQEMAAGNYGGALAALEQSLNARPGDPDALNLQTQAKGRQLVQDSKYLARQGQYIEADKKLQSALEFLPKDTEAKSLLAEYQPHEAGQLLQLKEQQTHAVFDSSCQKTPIGNLVEAHEYRTGKKSPEDFKEELIRLYAEESPKAKVKLNQMPQPGIYEILFEQSSSNPLVFARREMLVVIGKGKNDQTLVLFKNFEYQRRTTGNTINFVIGGSFEDNWVPLHSSRIQMTPAFEEQIRVGYRMMMRKVMKVVGESFDGN